MSPNMRKAIKRRTEEYFLVMVKIRYAGTDKTKWVPASEYRQNPIPGTYIIEERRTR